MTQAPVLLPPSRPSPALSNRRPRLECLLEESQWRTLKADVDAHADHHTALPAGAQAWLRIRTHTHSHSHQGEYHPASPISFIRAVFQSHPVSAVVTPSFLPQQAHRRP
ncbi:hypothetical protein D9615_009377 [Tricholomella constricta]|uniref:Uncharacterized protein n=1 Tax=Tricholomella constricta TaxID=117010 RepID=A0A8H5LZV2_9AGAR|nr:hypothetical protein D9615_009377 [Tricholomella constricta]